MRILLIAILSVSIGLVVGCKEEEKKNPALTQAWDEIIVLHDEIMPVTMKLPPIWETLDSLKNEVEEEQVEVIEENITNLKKAHKDMYDWMRESLAIKGMLKEADERSLPRVVRDEKARLIKMRDETFESYEEGQKLLETIENE